VSDQSYEPDATAPGSTDGSDVGRVQTCLLPTLEFPHRDAGILPQPALPKSGN
jgi:hypothetical protein